MFDKGFDGRVGKILKHTDLFVVDGNGLGKGHFEGPELVRQVPINGQSKLLRSYFNTQYFNLLIFNYDQQQQCLFMT